MDTEKLMAISYMAVIGFEMGLVMPLLTLALQENFSREGSELLHLLVSSSAPLAVRLF